ncbi:hypothetical protein PFICI_09607 [Pestalotiopsis fici W106-1]|uniref:Methyltransferase domain-containing protein n=1 Tax=Pestalotiopsis fici (strain W106-1 / CGMCC3.15140) TaxID=1229662 RepID=W3X177_PESFW|nr:uncharacterized protein PFICI_09607 [Pestalotiopsis fici W106-1]ETS79754.1 hypothetical protein PFICI_09607 [Pestalotiopsis fici W106-1]
MLQLSPDELRQKYFNSIAPSYARLTGNTTRHNFVAALEQSDLGITSKSVVLDNASGPGTATSALIPWCERRSLKPKIVLTDFTPGMIQEFDEIRSQHLQSELWQSTEAKVANALDLSASFREGHFTHVVDSFSVSTVGTKDQQQQSLREAYRVLSPGGLAVYLNWKRFPMSEMIDAAQADIKGEEWAREHRVPVNGAEFIQEGYLAQMMAGDGWDSSKIQTAQTSYLVQEGDDWDGLFEFLQVSPPSMIARRGFTAEEAAQWPEAIKRAMRKEKEVYGGVYTEAWIVLARK